MKKKILLLTISLCMLALPGCGQTTPAVNQEPASTPVSNETAPATINASDLDIASVTTFDGPCKSLEDSMGIRYCEKIENCVNYFIIFDSTLVTETIDTLEIHYTVNGQEVYTRTYTGGIQKDEYYYAGLDDFMLSNCESADLHFVVNGDDTLAWDITMDVDYENSVYSTVYDISPAENGEKMTSVVSG